MEKVFIGYSNDSTIRYHSSSGGIITAIIKHLFDTGYVGTYLSCSFNKEACCYEPKMIYSYNEYELVGSVYQDMDIMTFLKSHITDIKGRLMVVCSPCLVKAVRHIAKVHSIDVFIASYFCSGQTTIEGTYFYYKALGIDRTNVVNIRYRGDGWPNGITIQMKDGSVIQRANYSEPWKTMHQSRLYTPRRCFKCKQLESCFSDISVGDPWLKEYLDQDKTGHSLFIVHSELGLNVIEQMNSENLITCSSINYSLYEKSQKFTIQRKSRINEDKEIIDFELKLQNLRIYNDWATRNYTNMKKYVWIMVHIVQPYFRAKKMNSKMIITKLYNKILRKLNNEKNKTKYVIISGLNLTDNNRGTAALGYGAFYFLKEKNLLNYDDIVVTFKYYNNFFKKENTTLITSYVECNGHQVQCKNVPVFRFEKKLLDKFGIVLPFTRFGRLLKRIRLVAAINGGDGFSDIYSTATFFSRLHETNIAMKCNIPVIILPQTIGPFKEKSNRVIANRILQYATRIYVRDDKFIKELNSMGLKYEMTKDLSAYMKPQPIDIDIEPNAVGLNVSGLTYSNTFRTLSGQFASYPYLINAIIRYFQSQNVPIYLIPHSYNYNHPEESNDDLVAIRDLYAKLEDTTNIHVVDRDMISPQVKYVISQMSFFIGTRMHANFAAIYTKVPLFGLAYSYKFQGAFEANGIYDSTAMINNITEEECNAIVAKISNKFKQTK